MRNVLVHSYVYRVIQCENYLRFNHQAPQCRALPRCLKYVYSYTSENCQAHIEQNKCLLCAGDHKPTDRKCSMYQGESEIKTYIAKSSIGYKEAKLNYIQ